MVIASSVAGLSVSGLPRFFFGFLTGGTVAVYIALRDTPPGYIENWRLGSEGERLTGRALRPLAR
ncbi:MAG TPA: hypothetical protein VF660_04320, partial [Actinomycetota bacterium]